jgi:hypothetical protein
MPCVRLLILVPVLALVLAPAAAPAAGGGVNLLVNGGFETGPGAGNRPNGWYATVLQRTAAVVGFRWDDAVAHGGARSVCILIGADHPDERVFYNWTAVAEGWQAGRTYELAGWIRTEDLARPAAIVVQCWDQERHEMLGFASTQMRHPVSASTGWTEVRTTFTVPEGTAEVRVRAGITAPENRGGRAWFDDLAVRAVE